jgi:hypothetical protein
MESVIQANKENYYLGLRRTQQTIRKGKQNWEYWLVFFLRTMVKQKNNLAAKVKEEQALRSSLPALSRQILELAKRVERSPTEKSENQLMQTATRSKCTCESWRAPITWRKSGWAAEHDTRSSRFPIYGGVGVCGRIAAKK